MILCDSVHGVFCLIHRPCNTVHMHIKILSSSVLRVRVSTESDVSVGGEGSQNHYFVDEDSDSFNLSLFYRSGTV